MGIDRDTVTGKLTVFFEDPFWVGVFERTERGKLSVSRVTFGAEPKDAEVYEFALENYFCLRFSPAVAAVEETAKRNPKRIQREVKKQVQHKGIGTRSQQALKLQQEQFRLEKRIDLRKRTEQEKKKRFELKQQKKKEKHKGR